ncbi:hypothetical protein OAO91_11415 [Luminiphilus sp.]|nr:hypothetical protein [Luminiphilus sp.]
MAFGIARQGDAVELTTASHYEDCDVAVFFGSWKDRDVPHHNVKRSIVAHASNFVVLETPLIGRGPVTEAMDDSWYRVGVNGFLSDYGMFHDGVPKSADRWQQIADHFNIGLKDYRINDEGPVVVALQLPGDASLRGASIEQWCLATCKAIRTQTERQITIRLPQLQRQWDQEPLMAAGRLRNVNFQQGSAANLVPTLSRAFCTVSYSSGFAIDSLINGCPAIATNSANFAYPLGLTSVGCISRMKLPCREQWIRDLAHCQWSQDELADGAVWENLRPIIHYRELRASGGRMAKIV